MTFSDEELHLLLGAVRVAEAAARAAGAAGDEGRARCIALVARIQSEIDARQVRLIEAEVPPPAEMSVTNGDEEPGRDDDWTYLLGKAGR